MQANQTPVVWTVVVATILILILGAFSAAGLNSNLKLIGEKLDNIDIDIDEVALANAIVAGIVLPEVDTEKLDRVCELTDGCEYWDFEDYEGNLSISTIWTELQIHDAQEDFEDAFEDLIGLDFEDDFNFVGNFYSDFYEDDYQIRAYSDEDAEDGNWEVKVFMRVVYQDVDEDDKDDTEKVYVVVTSILDEGEYDSLSIKEVSRNFEFN